MEGSIIHYVTRDGGCSWKNFRKQLSYSCMYLTENNYFSKETDVAKEQSAEETSIKAGGEDCC